MGLGINIPLGKKFKLQIADLADILAVWPAILVVYRAARQLTVDNDGDGKAIEVEAGELQAAIDALIELAKAIKALNPIVPI